MLYRIRRGCSLIELVVALAVIAFLSLLTLFAVRKCCAAAARTKSSRHPEQPTRTYSDGKRGPRPAASQRDVHQKKTTVSDTPNLTTSTICLDEPGPKAQRGRN